MITNELPPIKYMENGRFQGMAVDLLVESLAGMGVVYDPANIIVTSWARTYEESLTKPGTICLTIVRTKQRRNLFKWVGPVHKLELALIGRRPDLGPRPTMADFKKYRVAAVRGTAPAQLLVSQGFPEEMVDYLAKPETALHMLSEGRLDFFAYTTEPFYHLLAENGLDNSEFKVAYVLKEVDLYFGLNRSFDDDFVARLQDSLNKLKAKDANGVSRYDEIVRSYVD